MEYDVTVYDPADKVLSKVCSELPMKRFLSFFGRAEQNVSNVAFFSGALDPIIFADNIGAASAEKHAFLDSARSSLIVADGIRGLEILMTALRYMVAGRISRLVVIGDPSLLDISSIGTDEERLSFEDSIQKGRLLFLQDLTIARIIDALRS